MDSNPQKRDDAGTQDLRREAGRWLRELREAAGRPRPGLGARRPETRHPREGRFRYPIRRTPRIALFQLDGKRLFRCRISKSETETLGQDLTLSHALGIYIAGRVEIALPGEAKNRRLRHARQKTIV